MPLVIGMREGDDVYLNEVKMTMEEILSPTRYRVAVEMPTIIHKFEVDDSRATRIMPDVTIQAGNRGSLDTARVAITAPRSVVIERGVVRRRKQYADSSI